MFSIWLEIAVKDSKFAIKCHLVLLSKEINPQPQTILDYITVERLITSKVSDINLLNKINFIEVIFL